MSDYLNSLVVRTLNLEPVVQPRLTSLFEPLSTAGPGATNAWQSESAFESPLSTNGVADAPPAPLPRQIIQPVPVRRDATETSGGSRVSIEPVNPFLPARPVATLSLPAHAPISGPNAESTRGVSVEEIPQRSAGTLTSEAANIYTRPRITPEVRRITPATDVEQNETSLKVPDPFPSPASEAPQEPAALTPQIAAAPTQAPDTVVVTIGRVDVRAVFAPPAVPPRSNRIQPQPMSLDEYLKQRSEGRR